MKILIVSLILAMVAVASAKERRAPKTQEVNFEGSDVTGTIRNPDGSYLVQKRGVKFVPMYKVKEHFDESIKESIEYVE